MATTIIPGIAALAPRYDILFCDVWGVIHNGRTVFAGVNEALSRWRSGGGRVILVSNAPRPATAIMPQLDALGLSREAWDAIVTSGDVTRTLIIENRSKPMFHLGPERDRPLIEGLALDLVPAEAAGIVLCTGLFDDTTETAETYRPMLEGFLGRAVPLICANPDIVVERAGKLIYCAGAIADLYQRLGGPVTWCGKPHRPIYEAAFAVARSLLGRDIAPERTLAVGDSLRTDLAGAAAIGCGALFVTGGIHAGEVEDKAGRIDPGRLSALLAAAGLAPDAAVPRLVW